MKTIKSRLMPKSRILKATSLSAVLAFGFFGSFHAYADQQSKTWTVLVYTSDVRKAGTGADVSIKLFGTSSVNGSGPYLLDNSAMDDFDRDEVGMYQFTTTADIGQIMSVELSHDNSRPGAGWHVGAVAVIAPDAPDRDFAGVAQTLPSVITLDSDAITPRAKGLSFYVFDRWLADDEFPNQGADKPSYTQRRRDYVAAVDDLGKNPIVGEGKWVNKCQGGPNCSAEIARSWSFGQSSSSNNSTEYWAAFEVALEKEFGWGTGTVTASAGANVSSGSEKGNSKEESYSESCGTSVDFSTNNKDVLWQWETTGSFLNQPLKVAECKFVCTVDPKPPLMHPNDSKARRTCL